MTTGFIRRHWPLLGALALLLLTVYLLRVISLRRTQGNVVYALDDAYIHMAMAKNLVRHGVWGVTADDFSSTSSSPLWTLLLALSYAAAGVNSLSPFILGLISACLVLVVADWTLRAFRAPPFVILFVLLALIFLTPLPNFIFSGMEHGLQTALTLAVAFLAARVLSSADTQTDPRYYYGLLALTPLITLVRFEGLFLAFVIALGSFLPKQMWRGFLFGLCAASPVVVYGVVSGLRGWPWLPTSVLLKSSLLEGSTPLSFLHAVIHGAYVNLGRGAHLVALILLAILLDVVARDAEGWAWNAERVMTAIFVGTGILHLGFAAVGWFYRYEAYLVALGIVVVGCRHKVLLQVLGRSTGAATPAREPRFVSAAAFLLVVSLILCSSRGITALKGIPQATVNLYEQQYQMGMFIKRYYPHSVVAIDDIGAVNFLADIHCLDLWGLATPAVARLRRRGDYGKEEIARLALERGAGIAVVHDFYYRHLGGLPPEWTKVGEWQVRNNVVGGSPAVSFYALKASEAGPLIAHLVGFSAELPPGVVQSGLYTRPVHSSR